MSPDPEPSPEDFDEVHRIIGDYLSNFATLEGAIDVAIEEALGLGKIQAAILCSNIPLRNKINILRVFVNKVYYGIASKNHIKALDRIANGITQDRNMIAHCYFAPPDFPAKGIKFYKVSANKVFKTPEILWTRDDCNARIAELQRLFSHMNGLAEDLALRMVRRGFRSEEKPTSRGDARAVVLDALAEAFGSLDAEEAE